MRISDWSSDVCSSDGLPGLRLQPLVELDRALQHAGGVARGAELADQAGGVPGGALGQRRLLQQDDVLLARLGEVVGDGAADDAAPDDEVLALRSEEHTSELQSLMRISYAVF